MVIIRYLVLAIESFCGSIVDEPQLSTAGACVFVKSSRAVLVPAARFWDESHFLREHSGSRINVTVPLSMLTQGTRTNDTRKDEIVIESFII